MIPGEYFISDMPIEANLGRKITSITVINTGDRPIQIGSHTHFFEVNKALSFPREVAYGYHLNIAAGTSIRFEPGDSRQVELVEFGGRKIVFGFNGLVNGSLIDNKERAIRKAKDLGFKGI